MKQSGVYQKGSLLLEELFSEIVRLNSDGETGAAAFFLGIARRTSKSNNEVSSVEMQSYEEHANKEIQKICSDVKERHGLKFVGIWHLIGTFPVGKPIVLVTASGRGRREVFEGLRETVERYKTEPAFFKKEVFVDGSYQWYEGA